MHHQLAQKTLLPDLARLLGVSFLALSLAVLSGCGEETSPRTSPTRPAAPTAAPAPEPTITPIMLTGQGQDVVPITLPQGTYLVAVQATGKEIGHFSVHFLDSTGEPSGGGLMVNTSLEAGQQFEGRSTLTIGGRFISNRPGPQLVEVRAAATTTWQVQVTNT